jgi:hypothetical protein
MLIALVYQMPVNDHSFKKERVPIMTPFLVELTDLKLSLLYNHFLYRYCCSVAVSYFNRVETTA